MKYILSFLFFASSVSCISQVRISVSTGIAGFAMNDMARHQNELREQFPVDVKVIEAFPLFWYYELAGNTEVTKRLRLGALVGYTSTGGRMHYNDYSGTITCDQLTTTVYVGASGEMLVNAEKWIVSLNWKAGGTFGSYDLDLFLRVDSQSDSENVKFRSTNLFAEPGLTLSKHLFSGLSATIYAGYNINFIKGKLALKEDRELHLIDNAGDNVNLDWTGFRVAVGLSVLL